MLVVHRVYCNFCGDHMGKNILECVDCGGFMCQQSEPTGPGCVWLLAPAMLKEFWCIICEPRHWRRMDDLPKGPDGGIQVGKRFNK